MPARIVVVHDEPAFADQVVDALSLAGHDVTALADPMAALDVLETAPPIEVLVTRVQFGPGKLHGIALARMARMRRPLLKVLFTARPEFEEEAEGLGEFIAAPVRVADVMDGVRRLLALGGPA